MSRSLGEAHYDVRARTDMLGPDLKKAETTLRGTLSRINEAKAESKIGLDTREFDRRLEAAQRKLVSLRMDKELGLKYDNRALLRAEADVKRFTNTSLKDLKRGLDDLDGGGRRKMGWLTAVMAPQRDVDNALKQMAAMERGVMSLFNRLKSAPRDIWKGLANLRIPVLGIQGRASLGAVAGIAAGGAGAIVNTGGAIGALGSVIGGGALGAGVLGAGGILGGAQALVGVKAALNVNLDLLKQTTAQYDKVRLAQAKYGQGSQQMQKQQIILNNMLHAQGAAGPNTARAAAALNAVESTWSAKVIQPVTRPIQGAIASGLGTAKTLIDSYFAKDSVRAVDILTHSLEGLFKMLRQPDVIKKLDESFRNFDKFLKPVGAGITNLVHAFIDIGAAGSRFLPQVGQSFDTFTGKLLRATENTKSLDQHTSVWFADLKSVVGTLAAFGRLLVDFFSQGQSAGQRMTNGMTDTFKKWDAWVKSPIGTNKVQKFFNDGATFAGQLAHAVGPLFSAFLRWGQAMTPVTTAFMWLITQITSFVNLLSQIPLVKTMHAAQGLGAALAAMFVVNRLMAFIGVFSQFRAGIRAATGEAGLLNRAMAFQAAAGAAGGAAAAGAGVAGAAAQGAKTVARDPATGRFVSLAEGAGATALVAGSGRFAGAKALGKTALRGASRAIMPLFAAQIADQILPASPGNTPNQYGLPSGAGQMATFGRDTATAFHDIANLDPGKFFHDMFHSDDLNKLRAFGDRLNSVKGTLDQLSPKQLRSLHDEAQRLADDPSLKKYRGDLLNIVTATDPLTVAMKHVSATANQDFTNMAAIGGGKLRDIRRELEVTTTDLKLKLDTGSAAGRAALAHNFALAAQDIRQSMAAGVISTQTGIAEISKLMARAMRALGVSGGPTAKDLAKVGDQGAGLYNFYQTGSGSGQATGQTGGGAKYAQGYFVGGNQPTDAHHALIGSREAVLTHQQQDPVNMALAFASAYGVVRERSLLDVVMGNPQPNYYAQGRVVTASEFGGHNDPSAFNRPTASGKIANDSLWGFAELSNPPGSLNFSALGHLPMGANITFNYNGKSVTAPKVDVGAGGAGLNGHVRAADLTYAVMRALGGSGLIDVGIQGAKGAKGGSGGAALTIAAPKWRGPGGLTGVIGQGVLGKVTSAANAYIAAHARTGGGPSSGGGFRSPGTQGPKGLGTFDGLQVADWIIPELNYARSHGWTGHITSGYRPGVDPHTATGTSEHQGTQYPHGAVDFGGYGAYAQRADFFAHVKGYHGLQLIPAAFADGGHASGTGHAQGRHPAHARPHRVRGAGGMSGSASHVPSDDPTKLPNYAHIGPIDTSDIQGLIDSANNDLTAITSGTFKSYPQQIKDDNALLKATLAAGPAGSAAGKGPTTAQKNSYANAVDRLAILRATDTRNMTGFEKMKYNARVAAAERAVANPPGGRAGKAPSAVQKAAWQKKVDTIRRRIELNTRKEKQLGDRGDPKKLQAKIAAWQRDLKTAQRFSNRYALDATKVTNLTSRLTLDQDNDDVGSWNRDFAARQSALLDEKSLVDNAVSYVKAHKLENTQFGQALLGEQTAIDTALFDDNKQAFSPTAPPLMTGAESATEADILARISVDQLGESATSPQSYAPELADTKNLVSLYEQVFREAQATGNPVSIRAAADQLKGARQQAQQLSDTISGTGAQTADQAALLAQAQEQARIAQNDAASSNAALTAFTSAGDIGGGGRSAYSAVVGSDTRSSGAIAGAPRSSDGGGSGVTVIQHIHTLHPADPNTLRAIGAAATGGMALQAYVPASRYRSGY